MEVKQKTKTYSTNKLFFPLLFVAFSLIIEMANFLYFGFETSAGSRMIFPTYFLFDLAIMFMIAGIIYASHHKIAIQILFHFFIFIQIAMNIVNTTLYGIFGDVFSFDLLTLGAEATTAFTFDLVDWGGVFLNLGIYAVIIVSHVLLVKFNKKTYTIKHFSTPIIILAFFIFIQAFGIGLIEIQSSALKVAAAEETEIEGSDKYLWENFQFKLDAYKKFGFFGFYTKGTINILTPEEIKGEKEKEYINYINLGHVEGNIEAPLYDENLIVILCESLDTFAIDPYLTPTLYKLQEGYNSISMTNFYARNRTNNSENAVLLGSSPKNITINDAFENGYKFNYSLPHLFEKSGNRKVATTYLHANTISFYNRNKTHGNEGIGFDKAYGIEAYKGEQKFKEFGKWITDLDYTSNMMDKIFPKKDRFLTFFTSLSAHGPYTEEKEYFTEYYEEYDLKFEQHKEWFINNTNFVWPEDQETINMLRHYKVGCMDLDRTVANLIQEMEIRGLSDNTSILLFADHNAYYHDLTYKIKGYTKTEYYEIGVNEIPLIFYSPSLLKSQGYQKNDEGYIQGYKIDSFCNTYDILPTLCDVYGMPYNKNLFHGYSIFSEDIEHSFFASHLGGMFTNKIYSQNITDIYIVDETTTEEEINRFKEDANRYYEKQAMLEILYRNGLNGSLI